MAKNKKKDSKDSPSFSFKESLREETIQGVWAVVFFVLFLFLVLSAMDLAGVVGTFTYDTFSYLLGIGYFLLPALLLLLSISCISNLKQHLGMSRVLGSALFFLSGLGLIDLTFDGGGGIIGNYILLPFTTFFGVITAGILLLSLVIIATLVILDVGISLESFRNLFSRSKKDTEDDQTYDDEEYDEYEYDDEYDDVGEYEDEEADDEESSDEDSEEGEKKSLTEKIFGGIGDKEEKSEKSFDPASLLSPYTPPPISILEKDRGKPEHGDIKANANIIKRTLQNFGIQVEMDEISIGPSVTRYSLKPAEGVRLSKIVGLQNNLELALAAHPVRIEAPIPGKSLVGIEVPNISKTTIGLASMLGSEQFKESQKPLYVALGKDISGNTHFANIAKMPHLLIAGATGSGKSVTIHALIASLLYHNSPQQLRIVMIDPKRVELTLYNNIPHLLTPVITSAKKAILALKWAAKEMDRRYDILEAESVRDIESYHKNVVAPALKQYEKRKENEYDNEEDEDLPEVMPYIVVMIDELADIMSAYPRELEAAIVRLAQMSRAVGIHLVLSTQRPSVNIITGLIKANIPSRIALQVASQIDSRTILDTGGAEKLLGAGDMLYLSGEMSKPTRIQAPFISETEVKKIVQYLHKNHENEPPTGIEFTEENTAGNSLFGASMEEEADNEDELYDEAREIVVHAGKASTSYLQRKLRVGYARAARLMDILEERGVIGPQDGAKPRDILERTPDQEEGYGERDEE